MLLEFSVGNFLSFKDPVTLSLEAAGISEYPENFIVQKRFRVLKSAVVYGANASGKSNLMRAMSTMRYLLRSSVRRNSTDELEVVPFLLCSDTIHAPSFFEVVFFLDEFRYRYGFEVTRERVKAEWLYQAKTKAEKRLFIREADVIEVHREYTEAKNLEEKTRSNALFLAVIDQFSGATAQRIMSWFANWNTISGLAHEEYRKITHDFFQQESKRQVLMDFLKSLDLGFHEMKIHHKEEETNFFSRMIPDLHSFVQEPGVEYGNSAHLARFKTQHAVFDAQGKTKEIRLFDLKTQESSGTNKLVDLLGPIFHTLHKGSILVVDELDAKLHPLITKALVRLFHDENSNPIQAQLIFATHDTNLLSYGGFRRDQIYFVEKDKVGATNLYSLVEYQEEGQTIRKDRSFEKDYIQGRYGAIPFLGDFSSLKQWVEKEEYPQD